MSILKKALKNEILFWADNDEIELTEEDAGNIADNMINNGDWSEFNDWISNEIDDYLEKKNKE